MFNLPLRSPFLGCLLCAALLLSSSRASAQTPTAPAAGNAAKPGSPARPVASPNITAVQLAAFAALIGSPVHVVWQRLLRDPTLARMAAAAADERISRKRSGTLRIIAGFSILGIGGFGAAAYMMSGPTSCDPDPYGRSYESSCVEDSQSHLMTALITAAASAIVGLSIGIPGIISVASESEIETAAADRYDRQRPPLPAVQRHPLSAAPAGYELKVPLLSVVF